MNNAHVSPAPRRADLAAGTTAPNAEALAGIWDLMPLPSAADVERRRLIRQGALARGMTMDEVDAIIDALVEARKDRERLAADHAAKMVSAPEPRHPYAAELKVGPISAKVSGDRTDWRKVIGGALVLGLSGALIVVGAREVDWRLAEASSRRGATGGARARAGRPGRGPPLLARAS